MRSVVAAWASGVCALRAVERMRIREERWVGRVVRVWRREWRAGEKGSFVLDIGVLCVGGELVVVGVWSRLWREPVGHDRRCYKGD